MYLLDTDFSKLPLWLIVVTLIAAMLLIIIALVTGREVTLWPPKIGEKKSTEPSGSKVTSGLEEDLGIKITSPDSAIDQGELLTVTGNFKKQPSVGSVKAIVLNENSNEYWLKGDVIFNSDDTWSARVKIDVKKAEVRKILIVSVGSHARALLEYQKKVFSTGAYVGLPYSDIIRDDVHIHDDIKVRVVPVSRS